jgi:putative Ca2+/H+ antiporter (TMEM165/GDT1 family)
LRPDTIDDDQRPSRWGPFLSATVLFFLAEMGDKTQLATLALGARFHGAFFVTLGSSLGMVASDGLAVFLGEKLAHRVRSRWLRTGAAALFFGFGAVSAWAAIMG